jgi:hypothetical protein
MAAPTPTKPRINIAQVAGSGTAPLVAKLSEISPLLSTLLRSIAIRPFVKLTRLESKFEKPEIERLLNDKKGLVEFSKL